MSEYKWSEPDTWNTFCYVEKGSDKLGFFQTYLELQALERQLAEARESSIKVSKYLKGVCEKRISVDGIYFGFVDGSWEKASDQLIAKQRYELGLEQLKEKG